MPEYDNEKRIVLFQNEKGGNENRPDYVGHLELEKVKWRVSVWEKQTSAGAPYLSGQIETFKEKSTQSSPTQPEAKAPAKPAFDDDIPF